MPATSERQRRFMGAELARKRAGQQTKTGMNEGQLSDFARKVPPRHRKKRMTARMQGDALKPRR